MPPLWGVAEALGLDSEVVHDVGELAAMRATQAMESVADEEEEDDETDAGPHGDPVEYVCDHGFRAVGQVALFDQHAAADLALDLGGWLRFRENDLWPLTLAAAPIRDPGRLAGDLNGVPVTAARDLARCLVPQSLREPASTRRAGARAGRTALSPYGIDLDLLQLVVLGETPDAHPAQVSRVSMAALVRTLFHGIERTLAEQRDDGYHWSAGLSVVQATDPEVLLVVRACLRSESAQEHVLELPPELPMSRALVELMREIGP